jgi:hypothetical protein
MHEKYAKKGLICMSLSVDELEDQERVLKFLKKQQATFRNFLVDDQAKVWKDYWNVFGPPAIFVFDKTGKRFGPFEEYAEAEEMVVKLLDGK